MVEAQRYYYLIALEYDTNSEQVPVANAVGCMYRYNNTTYWKLVAQDVFLLQILHKVSASCLLGEARLLTQSYDNDYLRKMQYCMWEWKFGTQKLIYSEL